MSRTFSFLLVLLLAGSVMGADLVITINSSNTYQQMEGFGAALTDSSAYLIDENLTTLQRQTLLNDLFSETSGIGLNYLRIPMGASDFRMDDYTYDDMPAGQTDYALTNFSIAHDEAYIIPILQEIQGVNTNLTIMASPWSPPAWMKDTDHLYYGQLNSGAYEVYAQYFIKFIEAYASNGLPIDAVTLQNEPLHEAFTYPSMTMSTSDQIDFATDLGSAFTSSGVATKIIIYDHNWDQFSYPITVMNDATANAYIDGAAFHGYGGDVSAQSLVHDAHPDKGIYFTEITAGDWSSTWGDQLMWDVQTLIIGATRNWAKTVVKWNIALDQNDGPKIDGGCDTCHGVVTINTNSGVVTKNADYYALGHASKFVRPGAMRVQADETAVDGPYSVAFVNPDESVVVIACNPDTLDKHYVLRWNDQSAGCLLPGRSVASFVWSNEVGAAVDVWLTLADGTKLLEKQSYPLAFHPLTLEWAGRTWTVRDTEGNPGGNAWDAGCAHVDANSNLCLEVKQIGNMWQSGQVDSEESLGHGTYRWYVLGRPDQLDSNVVAGIGTYFDSYHGLSIDHTTAYEDSLTNLFYNVEPFYAAGHREGKAYSSTSDYTTHEFTWNPRKVEYRSWYGHTEEPADAGSIIAEWTYEGTDVPGDTNELVRMNLWMFDALAPSVSQQLVLADFSYTCSTGTFLRDDFEDGSISNIWTTYGSGGQIQESGGLLSVTPDDSADDSHGVRTVTGLDWSDDGLTYSFSAILSTVTVTSLSGGDVDLWAYEALVSGSNGLYDAYSAANAAILRAGYDSTGDVLVIEFLTKTEERDSWGTSRYVGRVNSASAFFGNGGLELSFSLVYDDYRVEALQGGNPISMSTVSGSSTGTHNLGTALYTCEFVAGARNQDTGRGTVDWEEVEASAFVELESTAGGSGNGELGEAVIQIGDADHGTTWRSPIDTRYTGHRSQVLYDADLIDRSGVITQVLLYVLTPPDIRMDRYTIRMQHSALSSMPESFINSGWTTVYQEDLQIPSDTSGWYAFNLTNAFDYNGTNNLLIDFSFKNVSKDADPLPTASYTEAPYISTLSCSSDRDDPFDWTGYPRGRKFQHYGTRIVDVALVFPAPVEAPIGQNLSFEDGPLGFATNVPSWEVEGSVYAGSIKSAPALHKSQSLKIWKNGGDGDQKLYQYFDVVLTNEYTLSGYILSQSAEPFDGTNAYGAFMFEWYGSSGLLDRDESSPFTGEALNDVWSYFDVSGVPPSSCTSGRIVCALISSPDQEGSLFFDKLALTASPAPPDTNAAPAGKTTHLLDEFNDTSRSNCWELTGNFADTVYDEADGTFSIRPGTNWAFQHSGYISSQAVEWSNTNGWCVFSAVLSTVSVDSVSGTNDIEAVLGVCSEPDNPWYVTNSCGIYGYYDKSSDRLIVQLLTKTASAQASGSERYNATIAGVSSYLNPTNHIRISLALGEDRYELKLSDASGLPISVTVNNGSARALHGLGDSLCTAYWMIGAQNDNNKRGTVFWDRTQVYANQAPAGSLHGAVQTSTDGTGLVSISNTVNDANGDLCRLQVQASTNGGLTWFRPWISDVDGSLGAAVPSSQAEVQVVDAVTTNTEGFAVDNALVLTWDTLHANNAQALSGLTLTNVRVRTYVDDGDVSGICVTSAVFVLDNEGPASGGAEVTVEGGVGYVFGTTLDASWLGFTDAGASVSGYYCALADGSGTTNGTWFAASPGSRGGAVEDALNTVYVWARDSYGNIGGAVSDDIVVLSADGDYDSDGLANSDEGSYGADPTDPDTDSDDTGDGWEVTYGLNPTNLLDGAGDLDLDGYDNRSEFLCGTDPSNAVSTLSFGCQTLTPSDDLVIEWQSATGRIYDLSWRDGMEGQWQFVSDCTNVSGTGAMMSYTGSNAGVSTRLYRMRVTKP